ncbi:MAG: hypothetical protein IPO41_12325 [Acidobacteria bacterium]|nr:hypothetical protein [Acidobacteriota bacterium]
MKGRNFVRELLVLAAFAAIVLCTPADSFGQDASTFDRESIPATAAKAEGFVPKGWKIEEQIKGDVTADGVSDVLLKLIEDKPKKDDEFVDRNRVLVIAVADGNGGFRNAAVADKLLQCTSCGGAFYGVVDAPANVSIEKGVIAVNQDHGSRWVSDITFKFRYDEQPNMFILIGFDYSTRDRAEASVVSESINYLTGKRIATNSKGKKTTATISKKRWSIEEVDSEEFESAAAKRLGVD